MTKVWGALAVAAVLGGCVSNQNKPEEVAFCAREAGLPAGATVTQKQFGDAGSVTRFQPMPGMSARQLERANMCLASRSPNAIAQKLALRGFSTEVQDCRLQYVSQSRVKTSAPAGMGLLGVLVVAAASGAMQGVSESRYARCLAAAGTSQAVVDGGTGPAPAGMRGSISSSTVRAAQPVRPAGSARTSSACTPGGNVISGGAGYCTR